MDLFATTPSIQIQFLSAQFKMIFMRYTIEQLLFFLLILGQSVEKNKKQNKKPVINC